MKSFKQFLFLSILCSLVLFNACSEDEDSVTDTPTNTTDDDANTVLDADGDGVADADDTCADTPSGETVDSSGCSDSQKDTDGDGVTDDLDTCADTAEVDEVDENGCADSQKDTDGDGVTDDLDTCAETVEGADVNDSGCNITEHEFQTNSNSGVYSLLMTSTEYDDWISNDGFIDKEVGNLIFKDIYKKFPDDYDFIFLVLNEPDIPEDMDYYGQLRSVSNTITGTGMNPYDYSSEFGSEGKLKAVIQLTSLDYLRWGPSLHELMHNWGNFGFDTYDVNQPGDNITSYPIWGHWGFTGGSTKGQLGGFEQSTLLDLGDNNYSVAPFGTFANGGNSVPYNELELYLMGMVPLSSVAPFDLFSDITAWSVTETAYEFTANTRTTYDNAAIENLLGTRSPSFEDSQKEFKVLVVVLTDEALTTEEWNTIDATAERFSYPGVDDSSLNFWEATNGVGSIIIGE